MDLVSDTPAMRAASSVADDCRRLAERLRLDAVGVAVGVGDSRQVTWWAAPDGPALPSRLDDVLEGADPAWLLVKVASGDTVFARTTSETPDRAIDVLRAMAVSLVASAGGAQPRPGSLRTTSADVSSDPATEPEQAGLWEGSGISGLAGVLVALARDTGFETASLYISERHPMAAGRAGRTHATLARGARSIPGGVRRRRNPLRGRARRPRDRAAARGARMLQPRGAHRRRRQPDRAGLLHRPPRVGLDGAGAPPPRDDRGDRRGARARDRRARLPRARGDRTVRRGDPADPGGPRYHSQRPPPRARQALEADEIYHLVERAGDVDVVSETATGWPRRIPREIRDTLRSLPVYGEIDEATARQLGTVLGATSNHLTAAFSRERRPQEALVAGWRHGPGLSNAAMRSVAQLAAGARAVIESRRSAVDTMMTRERTRWADELHDGLTQAVTTAVLELEAMENLIKEDPKAAIEALAASKSEIRKSLSELRALLFDLQRDSSADSRSDEPLTKYVNDVVKRWRLPARVTVTGDLREVPKPSLGAAYVVIREGLANAAKHAGAGQVSVWVNAVPDELTVEVADTGSGFAANATPNEGPGHHFGLGMMHRRVEEAGGTLDVQSAPGKGTRVVARLPVRGS